MATLNPFDVQSRHIVEEDGTAEALYAGCGTRGGQQYVLQHLKKRGKEMTELDAIQILCAYGTPQDEDQFKAALDIAIKALQNIVVVKDMALWTGAKSLEAWKKVIEEIQNHAETLIETNEVLAIIKKYLNEMGV